MAETNEVSPLLVRLPKDLKDWLYEYAKENSRNMTGEIIQVLKGERSRAERKLGCDADQKYVR